MINCPNCQHQEMNGAIYCSHCGAQLVEADETTQKIPSSQASQEPGQSTSPPAESPSSLPPGRIRLRLLESGQDLSLVEREEYSLGRSADGQPIIPDVDLTPFDAYAKGVSRLHATLKMSESRITLMDLGSSNGTFLNGIRLAPYQDMPLADGDDIRLGKLKIKILWE